MNKLLTLGFLLGLLLGPGYYFVGKQLAGERVQAEPVFTPGTGVSRIASVWHPEVSLRLDPAMNPIQLRLELDALSPDMGSARRVESLYRASLTHEGRIVLDKDWLYGFEIPGRKRKFPEEIHNTTLATIRVQQTGDYLFTLAPLKEDERLRFSEIKVAVFRNAEGPQMTWVWVGVGLLVFCGGLGYWRMSREG